MKRRHVRARLNEAARVPVPRVRSEFADALEERLRASATLSTSRVPPHASAHATRRHRRLGGRLIPALASLLAFTVAGGVLLWAAPGSGPGHEVGLGGGFGAPGPVTHTPSPGGQHVLPSAAPWASPTPGDPRPPSGESEVPASPGAGIGTSPGPDAGETSAPWPTEAATELGPDGGQSPSEGPSPSGHDSHPSWDTDEDPQTGYAGPSETHPVGIAAEIQADHSVHVTWSVYDRGEFDSYVVIRSDRPSSPTWPADERTEVVARVARDEPCSVHDHPSSESRPVYRVVVLDADGREVARSHAVVPTERSPSHDVPRRPGVPMSG